MLPDRVSNPGPLTYESGALPIALRGPATSTDTWDLGSVSFVFKNTLTTTLNHKTCINTSGQGFFFFFLKKKDHIRYSKDSIDSE